MTLPKIAKRETRSHSPASIADVATYCKSCGSLVSHPPLSTKMRRMKLSPDQRAGAIIVLQRRYKAVLRGLETMRMVKNPHARDFVKGMKDYYNHIKRFLEMTFELMRVPQSDWIGDE